MTEQAQQPEQRLMRLDLWILVVLGVLGIGFFLLKFTDSFPSASIDLRTPKSVIVDKAKGWSRTLGYNPDGAIESTVFSFDDDGKTFLEYELGQRKANELMKNVVPIWVWRSRFCRPFQQEECTVGMSTDGHISYIDHSLPNDLKLPSVTHMQAKKLAEDFVQKTVGVSLAGDELIDDAEEKQLNRTDHYFNWKQPQPDFKDGKLYTYVNISGNQITQYNRYLHVPEKFQRKYARMRSWNNLLKSISNIVFVILSASIAFIFIWAFVNGRIRWKLAIIASIISALFALLGWFDNWPSLISEYDTASSLDQYITKAFIRLLASIGYSMIQAIVFVGALEPIYRLMFPQKIAVERLLTPLGLRSASVFRGLVAGLSVFGVHTAYVVAFYLVGQNLGFWSPLDVRDAETLSRLNPVFDAVNVGLFASTMEELMYRVLCLAIFQRLTKNFWVSNLLQAASWAFMHSDYPQEPAYVRGVELTIGGTFYGWVLRRFGLLSCILAHYTYDAFLGVTSLVMSQSISDRLLALTAILPGILALAISALLIRFKGVLVDETPLENVAVPLSAKPPPVHEIEPKVEIPYAGLSAKVRTLLVGVAVVAVVVSGLMKPRWLGHNDPISINRAQAVRISEQYLTKEGISTAGMQRVAWLSERSDETEMQYVFEKEGYRRAQSIERGIEPRLTWHVRFFKELEPTEYYVLLSGNGEIHSQYVIKDEDSPGPKPTPEQAEKLVRQFLAAYHPNLFPLELDKQPTVHDYKGRRDYDMTFSAPQYKAGAADFKVSTGTVGGDVSAFSTGWRIPDEWKFARQKKTNDDQKIAFALRTLFGGCIGLIVLWVIVDVLKSHAIRWKPAIIIGGIAGAVALLHALNALPSMFVEYKTEEALDTFITGHLVDVAVQVVSSSALIGLVTAFAYGGFRRTFGLSLPPMVRPILPTGLGGAGSNKQLWLDAVLGATAVCAIVFSVDRFIDFVATVTSPAVHIYALGYLAELTDEASVWIKVVLSAIASAALAPVLAAGAATLAARLLGGKFWKVMVAALVGIGVLGCGAYYWQEFAWQIVDVMLLAVAGYFFVARIARFNLLSYVLCGYGLAILPTLLALLRSAPQVYFGDIAVLIAALAAPFAYTLWLWTFAPKTTE